MNELTKRKKEIEDEIALHLSTLETQGRVGMSEPLVDAEGFPRNDVDLVAIRHARQRVICLRNDHKALMKEIEAELVCIHQRARETGSLSPNGGASTTAVAGSKSQQSMEIDDATTTTTTPPPRHFARIAQVAPGSPAEAAGLRPNDMLVRFGSITRDNFHKLQDVATVVSHSKDTALTLIVVRDANGNGSGTWRELELTLTPQTWSGRGLLGCNIVPQTCVEARMTN